MSDVLDLASHHLFDFLGKFFFSNLAIVDSTFMLLRHSVHVAEG